MISKAFLKILKEYPKARLEPFKNHSLARFIRHDLADFLRSRFTQHPDLIWKASPGIGQWADAPWIAIFDPLVTTSAQHGYYPEFLFDKNFEYMYLSFNQGMAELREEFSDKQTKEILINRAKILRERVNPLYKKRFSVLKIDLKSDNPHSRLALYEPGHVFGKKYTVSKLPSDEIFVNDIEEMIELYRLATLRGGTAEFDFSKSFEDDNREAYEEYSLESKRRLRYHRTIEKNPKLMKHAIEIHGYTCQVCGFNFENIYGALGHKFIEVHHKTPLGQLSIDQTIHLSPHDDFAVVCSNCHRMIHQKGAPEKFEDFINFFKKHIDLFNYQFKTKSLGGERLD